MLNRTTLLTFLFLCSAPCAYGLNFEVETPYISDSHAAVAENIRYAERHSEPQEKTRNLMFATGVLSSAIFNTGLHFVLPNTKSFKSQMAALLTWVAGIYGSGRVFYNSLIRSYLLGQAVSQMIRLSGAKKPFQEFSQFNTALLQDKKIEAAFKDYLNNTNHNPLTRDDAVRAFLSEQIRDACRRSRLTRTNSALFSGLFFSQLVLGYLPFRWLGE